MDAMSSDSEWETSSDNSSSEDQEEIGFQYGGQAQIILSYLEESIGKIYDFLSFERAFVHGDVVCSLSYQTGQMGRVTNVDVFVDAGLVYVNWIASVLSSSDLNADAPPCWQDFENLTMCFSDANWQLGDWCMLSVADKEEQITMEHSMTRECKSEGKSLNSYNGELFITVKIKTKVEILWKNGEHSLGLDSENLLPVNVINTHEFCLHQFVLEKGKYGI